jgi:Dolichyl-phosphate-mannose-protein mannosyltransferase/PA14 domain
LSRSLLLFSLLTIAAVAAVGRASLETGQGLHGEYVAERRWGRDVRTRIDRQISTAALDAAWNGSPPQIFSAQWSGFLVVGRSGSYTFATTSDDASRVVVDDLVVVDNSGNQTRTGFVRLVAGVHPVRVEYGQIGGAYAMDWMWAREDGRLTTVPWWVLWTTQPTYARALAARVVDPAPILALIACALIAFRALWQRDWTVHGGRLHVDWALILILALGAYFRLQYVRLPIAEAHSWRQITNADIARNFSERSLNILYPQVSWGGAGDAYVGMEFPLIQWIAAVVFRFAGPRDVVCRAIAIAFSLATIAGLYGLGTRLWGRPAGRAAAFMYAMSPSAIFFGRAFISDTAMVCFSVFAVWAFVNYFASRALTTLAWATAAAALACMVKIPAVMILAPIAFMAWQADRWALLRDRAFLASVSVVLLLTAAWYLHADRLFHQTGLGEAIWHPSGGYSPDIMEAAGPTLTVSHWSTFAQLTDVEFYRTLLTRIWTLHFTPAVTLLVGAGAVLFWNAPHRRMVDVWFLTVVAFILVSAEGNRWHEFHQLPLLLPAALYFGLGARPAFDGVWLRRIAPYGLGFVAAGGALVAIAIVGVQESRVVETLFRPDRLDRRPIILGQQLREGTPGDALVVTVEYDRYGGNSPLVLYHAQRRGWSFDAASITPEVVRRLHSQYGARFFVTLIWSVLEQQRPELTKYLATQERLPLSGPADSAAFAIR